MLVGAGGPPSCAPSHSPRFDHIPLLIGCPGHASGSEVPPAAHREASFAPPYFLTEAPSQCESHPVGILEGGIASRSNSPPAVS